MIQKLQNLINKFYDKKDLFYNLPPDRNNRKWKWEGKDYPRVQSLLFFEEIYNLNCSRAQNLLTFNGAEDPEVEIVGALKHFNVEYEEDIVNHDLHNLNLDYGEIFDFVLLNQTVEHLYDPITCLKNIKKYMKNNSCIYINAPANNIPHGEPHHFYTGFTPMGIGAILEAAGFNVFSIGYWGNRKYVDFIFKHNTWPDYRQMGNLINTKECPCIVWAFGEKI
jgi:SAM-dependent methyltransferase